MIISSASQFKYGAVPHAVCFLFVKCKSKDRRLNRIVLHFLLVVCKLDALK